MGQKAQADLVVGGRCVDIILGIRYLKYYPDLVYSLPSGLAVYKARLKSASGCQAVLGGPHAAWTRAAEQTQHMNPRVYFTKEARAWYVEEKWVSIKTSLGRWSGTWTPRRTLTSPPWWRCWTSRRSSTTAATATARRVLGCTVLPARSDSCGE